MQVRPVNAIRVLNSTLRLSGSYDVGVSWAPLSTFGLLVKTA